MKSKIISKEGNEIWIHLEDTPYYVANSIRRSILEYVKTFAIEDVYIKKNTSAMWDEVLALRLGLIVLKADEGVKRATFELKAKGPKWVYAEELKIKDIEGKGNVEILYPKTILAYLDEDQEIELEAIAIWGCGKEHVKWVPAHVFYKYMPKLTQTVEKLDKKLEDLCPRKLYKIEKGKLKIPNVKDFILNCDICKACEDYSEGKIRIEEDENNIIFYIESFGQYSPEEVFNKGIEELKNKLNELKEKL